MLLKAKNDIMSIYARNNNKFNNVKSKINVCAEVQRVEIHQAAMQASLPPRLRLVKRLQSALDKFEIEDFVDDVVVARVSLLKTRDGVPGLLLKV